MNEYMKVLGRVCEDKVTGYKGVATSVSFELYGCVQVVLVPDTKDKPSSAVDSNGRWFDYKRLKISKQVRMPAPNFETPTEHVKTVAKPRKKEAVNGPGEKPFRRF